MAVTPNPRPSTAPVGRPAPAAGSAPAANQAPAVSAAPTAPVDRLVTSPGACLERQFDPGLAARTVMAKFGNHTGMLIVIQARGGDQHQFNAQQRADALQGIRSALGLSPTSQHPTALELRDMDHYINMFGPIQDKLPVRDGDGRLARAFTHLRRGLLGVESAAMAVGYTSAKAIAQHPTPYFPPSVWISHSEYLNGQGTSRASWHEMTDGLRGVWDGVTVDVPLRR